MTGSDSGDSGSVSRTRRPNDKRAAFIAGEPVYELVGQFGWHEARRDGSVWKSTRLNRLNSRLALVVRAVPRIMSKATILGDMVEALSQGAIDRAKRIAITAAQTPVPNRMFVSRTYGFLWVENPKVATQSTTAALLGVDPHIEIIPGRRALDVYARYPDLRAYYSFAFVRNPFHRAISLYRELHFAHEIYTGKHRRHKAWKRRTFFDRFHGLEETRCFDDYCRWLNTPYASDVFADRHFRSQHLLIRLPNGRLPDFVGRCETLEADWNRVAAHLGMPSPALPMLNTMAGWQAAADTVKSSRSAMEGLLTEPNKALLRTRYAEDFPLGSYSSD